jgi:pimeloyl-ACP methyl ester carboxylesterase
MAFSNFRNLGIAVVTGTVALAGCGQSGDPASDDLFPSAIVKVSDSTLDDYVGIYRLPSGALFPITRTQDHLYGGTPATELHAQTTRRFTCNGFFGEIRFDRDSTGKVHRLDFRQAKQSQWCNRVDPGETSDPTKLIDAGGFRLRMLTVGRGSPAIVLEDGFGNGIEMQSSLQSALSDVSCVVAYDHAGTGGSDEGPEPRNARQVAHELHLALANANVHPPYIMVGGSIGAEYCRVFAYEYPDDTAGLVLLDPTPVWDELLQWAEVNASERVKNYRRVCHDSQLAMDRLMERQEVGRFAEWKQLAVSRQQAQDALPLPQIPVVQITGAGGRQYSSLVDDKVRFFDAWLQKHIPHARHVLAQNSAHAISITDQELVVEQVRRLVKKQED